MVPVIALLLSATAPAAQPSEQTIAAFVAALPPSSRKKSESEDIAAERAEAAKQFPAKKAEVTRIFDQFTSCQEKAVSAETDRALRATALALTEQELQSLTTFYSGADYKRFGELQDLAEKRTLTAAEKAEEKAIMDRYPLQKFGEATMKIAGSFDNKDALFADLDTCGAAKDKSLEALGAE